MMIKKKERELLEKLESEIEVCNHYIERGLKDRVSYHLGYISALDMILGTDSKLRLKIFSATCDWVLS